MSFQRCPRYSCILAPDGGCGGCETDPSTPDLLAAAALSDLIDSLGDELSYEVSWSPEVREQVKRSLAVLGSDAYSDTWWLHGVPPKRGES